ncbi:hypothetical protein WN51_05662 [Melipona quadrifasciata]|uniref:Uncharacterized protein n=1 Tax=Melipona quadrifasciata TaxID=166423 RepID=A0A0M8ZUF9_9HYME|nr:hypothetical protein WN51_05662 [Melipona quadrifasciata]
MEILYNECEGADPCNPGITSEQSNGYPSKVIGPHLPSRLYKTGTPSTGKGVCVKFTTPKESTEAFSVPFLSTSGNCGPKVGHKGRLVAVLCDLAGPCFTHVRGSSMIQSTVEGLVCCRTRLSQTAKVLWRHRPARGSGHLKHINFPQRACTQTQNRTFRDGQSGQFLGKIDPAENFRPGNLPSKSTFFYLKGRNRMKRRKYKGQRFLNIPYEHTIRTIDDLSSNHLSYTRNHHQSRTETKPLHTLHRLEALEKNMQHIPINQNIKNQDDIDSQIDILPRNIHFAFHKATRPNGTTGRSSITNPYLQNLIRDRNRYTRKYQKTGHLLHRPHRNLLTTLIQKRLTAIRNNSWQKRSDKIDKVDYTGKPTS